MRRDYFTVDIRHDAGMPTLGIEYDGPSGKLRSRLRTAEGEAVDATDLDIAFRYQPTGDDGVLSLTDRLTGEFILEVELPVADVEGLVEAAGNHDGDGEYRLRLVDDAGEEHSYEKRMLLVYDYDGELLRGRSLIPGSVEL